MARASSAAAGRFSNTAVRATSQTSPATIATTTSPRDQSTTDQPPPALVAQLAPGGLMVAPIDFDGRQKVMKFEKGEPGFSSYTSAHPTTELHESGGYVHPSVTRVRTLGCYAYQVDGIGFSYSIVFRAVAG